MDIKLVALEQSPSFMRDVGEMKDYWEQLPERATFALPVRPQKDDHILVDGQDWYVHRVTLEADEVTITVHARFNGRTDSK